MLVGSYFCTHVSHLLGFNTDDVVQFDIKYFFLERSGLRDSSNKPV